MLRGSTLYRTVANNCTLFESCVCEALEIAYYNRGG